MPSYETGLSIPPSSSSSALIHVSPPAAAAVRHDAPPVDVVPAVVAELPLAERGDVGGVLVLEDGLALLRHRRPPALAGGRGRARLELSRPVLGGQAGGGLLGGVVVAALADVPVASEKGLASHRGEGAG